MKNIIQIFISIILLGIWSCGNCDDIVLEPCGGSNSTPKVDLIVIMDQSSSMDDEAQAVSNASERAIEASGDSCSTDLRVKYIGVGGAAWPTTLFDTSHVDYLTNIRGSGITNQMASFNLLPVGQFGEQGADAAADLSEFFDWRNDACRAILYISDEPLDGNTSISVTDTAIENAIQKATENNVTLFTIFIPLDAFNNPQNINEYIKLSESTGGMAFIDSAVDIDTYIRLMPQVVCNSCNSCTLNQF